MSDDNMLLMDKLFKKISSFTNEIRLLRDTNTEIKKKYENTIKQMTIDKNKLQKSFNSNKNELSKIKQDNIRLSNKINLLTMKLNAKSKVSTGILSNNNTNNNKSSYKYSYNKYSNNNQNNNTSFVSTAKSRSDHSYVSNNNNNNANCNLNKHMSLRSNKPLSTKQVSNYRINTDNINKTQDNSSISKTSRYNNNPYDFYRKSTDISKANNLKTIHNNNVNSNSNNKNNIPRLSNNTKYLKNLQNRLKISENNDTDINNAKTLNNTNISNNITRNYKTKSTKDINTSKNEILKASNKQEMNKIKSYNYNTISNNDHSRSKRKNTNNKEYVDIFDYESIHWSRDESKSVRTLSINHERSYDTSVNKITHKANYSCLNENSQAMSLEKNEIDNLKSKLTPRSNNNEVNYNNNSITKEISDFKTRNNSINANYNNNIKSIIKHNNKSASKSNNNNNTASFISIIEEDNKDNRDINNKNHDKNDNKDNKDNNDNNHTSVIKNSVTNNQNIYNFNFEKESLKINNEFLVEMFYSMNEEEKEIEEMINSLIKMKVSVIDIKDYLFIHDYNYDYTTNEKLGNRFLDILEDKKNELSNEIKKDEEKINTGCNDDKDKMLINFESFCDLKKNIKTS